MSSSSEITTNQPTGPVPASLAETQALTAPGHSGPRALPKLPGYEIHAEVGRGGMGVVYRATDLRLKRTVAIKMLLNAYGFSAEDVRRFTAEAEALARLQHPHIVQVYEVGEFEGAPYCVMEFVAGSNLEATPQVHRSAAEVTRLMLSIAEAVAGAHQKGIVHRDLKPSNILMSEEAVPKLADFGLAKLDPALSSSAGERVSTKSGAILGTPCYMAPEQAAGHLDSIGPRTDVYGLGVVLYKLLTNRVPFLGSNLLDTLEQVRSKEPPGPRSINRQVPYELEVICLKCLQKDPTRRYASCADLVADLQRYQAGEPIRARKPGIFSHLLGWMRKRQRMRDCGTVMFFVAFFLILLTLVAYYSVLGGSLEDTLIYLVGPLTLFTILSAVGGVLVIRENRIGVFLALLSSLFLAFGPSVIIIITSSMFLDGSRTFDVILALLIPVLLGVPLFFAVSAWLAYRRLQMATGAPRGSRWRWWAGLLGVILVITTLVSVSHHRESARKQGLRVYLTAIEGRLKEYDNEWSLKNQLNKEEWERGGNQNRASEVWKDVVAEKLDREPTDDAAQVIKEILQGQPGSGSSAPMVHAPKLRELVSLGAPSFYLKAGDTNHIIAYLETSLAPALQNKDGPAIVRDVTVLAAVCVGVLDYGWAGPLNGAKPQSFLINLFVELATQIGTTDFLTSAERVALARQMQRVAQAAGRKHRKFVLETRRQRWEDLKSYHWSREKMIGQRLGRHSKSGVMGPGSSLNFRAIAWEVWNNYLKPLQLSRDVPALEDCLISELVFFSSEVSGRWPKGPLPVDMAPFPFEMPDGGKWKIQNFDSLWLSNWSILDTAEYLHRMTQRLDTMSKALSDR